ncbi:hypothetical protein MMC09_006949 [Bachmanniomyces sp. S44760]|nr:hypothetical protein [Bachmanniomyces sp. S44760]
MTDYKSAGTPVPPYEANNAPQPYGAPQPVQPPMQQSYSHDGINPSHQREYEQAYPSQGQNIPQHPQGATSPPPGMPAQQPMPSPQGGEYYHNDKQQYSTQTAGSPQPVYQGQQPGQPMHQGQLPGQPMHQGQQVQSGQVYQSAIPISALTSNPAPVDCPACRQRALTRIMYHTGNTTL